MSKHFCFFLFYLFFPFFELKLSSPCMHTRRTTPNTSKSLFRFLRLIFAQSTAKPFNHHGVKKAHQHKPKGQRKWRFLRQGQQGQACQKRPRRSRCCEEVVVCRQTWSVTNTRYINMPKARTRHHEPHQLWGDLTTLAPLRENFLTLHFKKSTANQIMAQSRQPQSESALLLTTIKRTKTTTNLLPDPKRHPGPHLLLKSQSPRPSLLPKRLPRRKQSLSRSPPS